MPEWFLFGEKESMELKEYGAESFVVNIEVGEDIGLEVHPKTDQFFYVLKKAKDLFK